MPLHFASLNSGSNGNCYYIGNQTEAVMVDAGISCRETERRMERMGLNIECVKAIFVSHEHSDHTRGIEVISRKFNIPVYITAETLRHSRMALEPWLTRLFRPYEPVTVGHLSVLAFPKFHDGMDPHSFTVTAGETTIGVFTDIGEPCEHVIANFSKCHVAFLEANYDEVMLVTGRYPWYLKNRILSKVGHLSNAQALELFMAYRPPFMSHLLLSHLSQDNNDPKLVYDLFSREADGIHVSIASRFGETPVYTLGGPQHLAVNLSGGIVH